MSQLIRAELLKIRTTTMVLGADRQVNGLGVDTRADHIDTLAALLADRGVEMVGWYGVRLFTDGWSPDRPADDPEDLVLTVELGASRRDPYRRLSRLFHLIGRRRSTDSDPTA